jgi:hypothetical protein
MVALIIVDVDLQIGLKFPFLAIAETYGSGVTNELSP